MFSNRAFAIVSAERSNLTAEENAHRTRALSRLLLTAGIPHMPCHGVWEGKAEVSFVVWEGFDGQHLDVARAVALQFNQDAFITAEPEFFTATLHNGSDGEVLSRSTGFKLFGSHEQLPRGTQGYTEFPSGSRLVIQFWTEVPHATE